MIVSVFKSLNAALTFISHRFMQPDSLTPPKVQTTWFHFHPILHIIMQSFRGVQQGALTSGISRRNMKSRRLGGASQRCSPLMWQCTCKLALPLLVRHSASTSSLHAHRNAEGENVRPATQP
jgi:hypothetical protein